MFRGRDLVAAFLAVLLTRMAWTENYASESLSATLRLAFYAPRSLSVDEETSASPVPLDVDGDGTVEALALATRLNVTGSSTTSWTIEVVDLKPIHKSFHSGPQTTPFRPKVLFTSQAIASPSSDEHDEVVPLKMTSGQVLVKPRHHHHHHHHHPHKEVESDPSSKSDDRTRHFFCGRDWHDATNNCHQHCPGGTSAECPDEMMCYADTMCDALRTHSAQDETDLKLELTPGGGLPSIATLWSDGTVTMHSITADVSSEDLHEKHRPKRHYSPSRLELRLMWRSPKILEHMGDDWIFEEFDVILLGAEDVIPASSGSKKGLGKHGMVVVGGSYSTPDDYDLPFVQALDAMKGELLWEEQAPTDTENNEDEANTTVVRGSTSSARRRSRVPTRTSDKEPADTGTPNCMISYRHSLLDPATGALPYAYWGPFDSRLVATHFNRQKRRRTKQTKKHGRKQKKWSSSLVHKGKATKIDAVYGRPNVLINHYEGGLQVRSLKNGRPVCHISLLDEVLYADLNNDGILDHVQVVTEDHAALVDNLSGEYSDKWVKDLVSRLETANQEEKQKGFAQHRKPPSRLCHIMALSGMPAREELFSAPLCNTFSLMNRQGDHPSHSSYLTAAPPLVVERMDGNSHAGSDVVVATNNGMVSRFQAPTGKRQWQISHQEALPTWGDDGYGAPLLSRIDFIKATYLPWIRPILLTGEDGMALLSAGQGRVLASTTFPQTSIGRPVLADVSGDGTTDVIIVSADAIWGYQVVVRTGGSIVFRVMVGLLLVGVGIALLRNRFGQREGVDKRSTDS